MKKRIKEKIMRRMEQRNMSMRETTEHEEQFSEQDKANEPVADPETVENKSVDLDAAINPMETEQRPTTFEKMIENAGIKIGDQQVATDTEKVAVQNAKSPTVDRSIIDGLNASTLNKVRELAQNPLYASRQEKNGHFIIGESADGKMKLMVYGEGGMSDLTSRVYIYAKTHDKIGKAKVLSLADIEKGGMGLTNYMYNYGNRFSQAEISIAANRLWLLNKLGKLEMTELEPRMDAKSIHDFFMGKIAKGFEGVETLGIYAEEIEQGANRGRIDIGIWEDDFAAYWEEIQGETDMSMREWLKQAKAMGWLLPDKGRGGGQHTPSARNAQLYGHKPTERIQRFNVPKKQAHNWLNLRNIQNMMK